MDERSTGAPAVEYVCDLSAFTPAQRQAHQQLSAQLFGELAQETRELPEGFAWRLDGAHYELVAAFVAGERRCCPFLRFGLDVSPHGGALWLQLTAAGDARPFLRAELGLAGPANPAPAPGT